MGLAGGVVVTGEHQPLSGGSTVSGADDTGGPADEALQLVRRLTDSLEADPVTSWTADDLYAALTRLARIAEKKRSDAEVVRGGRPPIRSRHPRIRL